MEQHPGLALHRACRFLFLSFFFFFFFLFRKEIHTYYASAFESSPFFQVRQDLEYLVEHSLTLTVIAQLYMKGEEILASAIFGAITVCL